MYANLVGDAAELLVLAQPRLKRHVVALALSQARVALDLQKGHEFGRQCHAVIGVHNERLHVSLQRDATLFDERRVFVAKRLLWRKIR